MKKLKIGVAGLGRAFLLMLPAFSADPRVELVAGADPRPDARRRFQSQFQGNTYESVEELCGDASVDAVYVATPHQYHVEHALTAARSGKHLLVEKPMALTLEHCRAMIDAAQKSGVQLIVGHSHSFDAPILRTREIIAGGDVGNARMITALNFTDFLYRPRGPEELDSAVGGGVLFNQAAHQVDIVRFLGGGLVKSVHAVTGLWDPARRAEGAYSALLKFEDGLFASLTYSGYAHFDSDSLVGWISEMGHRKDPDAYGAARKLLASAGDEVSLKDERRYGRAEYATRSGLSHQHFGMVLVSCDHADLRPLPWGVEIFGDADKHLDSLPAPDIPRVEVIDELYESVVQGREPIHSGQWALATTEVCLAMRESSARHTEVPLRNQCALPKRRP